MLFRSTIVISERMAKKFFMNTQCVGKILILDNENHKKLLKITGVLKEIPAQSSIQFDYIIPFSKFLSENSWAAETGSAANQIWVLLGNNVDKVVVNSKLKNLIKNQETTLNQELFLFPMTERNLYSYANGKRVWTEMQNLVIVGCIGFAILLIACFNFINLAIALNIKRNKEAGIKKVVGSKRRTIVLQFLMETLIITLISLVSAIILDKFLITGFNALFGGSIQLNLTDYRLVLFFAVITSFTALVSGFFPALYLASSNTISVLKGKINTSHSFNLFRQGLIVFQFTIPIVLIICMLVIKTQDKYMRDFNIGVDKDRLIVLDNSKNIRSHAESVKAELLSVPEIDGVSFTNCIPSKGATVSNDVNWDGKDASSRVVPDGQYRISVFDYDFLVTVDSKLPTVAVGVGRFTSCRISNRTMCIDNKSIKTNPCGNRRCSPSN